MDGGPPVFPRYAEDEEDDVSDKLGAYDDNEDVDPAIFDDPVLMVKWLEKKQKDRDAKALKQQEQAYREAPHLEGQEHLKVTQ